MLPKRSSPRTVPFHEIQGVSDRAYCSPFLVGWSDVEPTLKLQRKPHTKIIPTNSEIALQILLWSNLRSRTQCDLLKKGEHELNGISLRRVHVVHPLERTHGN